MFSRLQRSHVLARSLQRCVQRPVVSSLAIRPANLTQRAPVLAVRSFQLSASLRNPPSASAQAAEKPVEDSGLITKFGDLGASGLVNERLVKTITQGMGLSTMTDVQVATINETIKGTDVLAQAKTGTGKTIAFLLPVIHRILQDPQLQTRPRYGSRGRSTAEDIRAVVISPTRELAEQIAEEARKVTRGSGVIVQTAVGGTRKMEGLRRIQREGCHLLVGTPGRLIDIFSDPNTGVSAPKLEAFVLDEADRLLDIGFAPDIERLQTHFPSHAEQDRQTLMFSATVPRSVLSLVRSTMKPDFKYINTIKEDEVPTHLSVPQKVVFLKGPGNQLPTLVELAKQAVHNHKTDPAKHRPFKAIVYLNSTAEVSLMHRAFQELREDPDDTYSVHPLRLPAVEMHSRLTQSQRTRNSEKFRRATSGVLFSSDVTARGMDFPDVTHVIQFGVPRDTESYVHRLGRTARANKTGEGWLFITDPEYGVFTDKLRRLPIKEDSTSLQSPLADVTDSAQHPASVATTLAQVTGAYKRVPDDDKIKAYMASMNGVLTCRDKAEAVRQLNEATKVWGLPEPPSVSPNTLNKMGLGRVRGMNTSGSGPRLSDSRSGSGFGSRSPSGGGFGRSGSRGFDRSESRGFDRSGSRGGFSRSDSGSRFGSGRDSGFGGRGSRSGSAPRRSFDRRDGGSSRW